MVVRKLSARELLGARFLIAPANSSFGRQIKQGSERKAAEKAAALIKLADRIAKLEACEPGSEQASQYAREHHSFTAEVRLLVPSEMWARYDAGISSRE